MHHARMLLIGEFDHKLCVRAAVEFEVKEKPKLEPTCVRHTCCMLRIAYHHSASLRGCFRHWLFIHVVSFDLDVHNKRIVRAITGN